MMPLIQQYETVKCTFKVQEKDVNPSPAEPGYTLPLQTV